MLRPDLRLLRGHHRPRMTLMTRSMSASASVSGGRPARRHAREGVGDPPPLEVGESCTVVLVDRPLTRDAALERREPHPSVAPSPGEDVGEPLVELDREMLVLPDRLASMGGERTRRERHVAPCYSTAPVRTGQPCAASRSPAGAGLRGAAVQIARGDRCRQRSVSDEPEVQRRRAGPTCNSQPLVTTSSNASRSRGPTSAAESRIRLMLPAPASAGC
jgi:hypothetical protein